MGHSLGEYGALVAAGAMSFEAALEAVSARGHEMASLELEDPGAMAAVMAPLEEVEEIVAGTDGYVVLANVNSTHQVVLGGATEAVGRSRRGPAGARAPSDAVAGQPRLPHRDRGPRERAAARGAQAAWAARAAAADRGQRQRRALPDRRGRRGADARHPRPPGRLPRAVRQGPADALRRGRAGLRRGRAQARAAAALPPTCSARTR